MKKTYVCFIFCFASQLVAMESIRDMQAPQSIGDRHRVAAAVMQAATTVKPVQQIPPVTQPKK